MTALPRSTLLLALLPLLLVLFVASLALGSVAIPPGAVFAALVGSPTDPPAWATIVREVRLPRALTATLAGAALAVGGLQMQTLFRNPLADPFVLGVSAGASLGVALVVLLAGGATSGVLLAVSGWAQAIGVVLAATTGAAVVLLLVLLLARRLADSVTLLVVGLMLGYFTSAMVSVLLSFSSAERIQAYVTWTFGSFGGVSNSQLPVLASVLLFALALAFTLAKPLNLLLLGEAYATSMGLAVARVRLLIIASAAILAGAVTAFCGPIAFLGVAVPHLARGVLASADHRLLLPAVACLGACVALLADLLARLPGSDLALPLNAVLALLGAPVVIAVLLRQRTLAGTPG